MLTRTQALEGGANVTCIISKVQFTYRSFIRLTILGHYATACDWSSPVNNKSMSSDTNKKCVAVLQGEIISHPSTDILSQMRLLENHPKIDWTGKRTFSLKHRRLRLYTSKGHGLHLESAHKHNSHIKEKLHDPRCCIRCMHPPSLSLRASASEPPSLSLKWLIFRKTYWDRSKCKCLGKRTGHAHWDQVPLQKEIDMLPTCCLCPMGSIPQHLTTLSAICAWDHQWTLD